MNTCGTCKYFGAARLGTDDDPSITVADFASVMIAQSETESHSEEGRLGPYKVCGLIEMKAYGELPAAANRMAFVEDGSNYYAALCVSEDFGCNQWMPK
jgi:hypothetical protein